jgi:hypothetical protein
MGHSVADRFVPTEEVCIAWNDHVARALAVKLPADARERCHLLY